MILRQVSTPVLCVAAALLLQSCAGYETTDGYGPPAPPSYPPHYGPVPPAPPVTPPVPAVAGPDDALVAPIALYPDPLVALILPAATSPADISAAASFLIQYGGGSRVDGQPWDPSVRALAHYPTVITWMAANMEWTLALGAAFLSSPGDVMDAVQRLRARALAAGTLASTPQEQVYAEGGEIEIYPAQPDFLYVPAYDDSTVYSDGPYYGYPGPFMNFGEPYPAGPWLSFYFDWGQHQVWAGGHDVWSEHHGWQPPRVGGDRHPPGASPWHPPAHATRALPGPGPTGGRVPAPRPMAGTPTAPPHPPMPRAAAPSFGQARPAYALPPPPPGRSYSTPAPARASAPAVAHSEPAHASAPAPAPSNPNQPQK